MIITRTDVIKPAVLLVPSVFARPLLQPVGARAAALFTLDNYSKMAWLASKVC